uniref:Uncharacterized protein n=1 Tax=Onchocerca volvulus TaxID=6282 RepID=A0A8R1XZR6_ONCVO
MEWQRSTARQRSISMHMNPNDLATGDYKNTEKKKQTGIQL